MQKKISGIFKSMTISRTFECTTNSRTAELQAQYISSRFTLMYGICLHVHVT